jgi:hypothetical protein
MISQDVPHRLVVSYVLDLPVGKGKKFLAGIGGAPGKLISGWGVNGVLTFQSGFRLGLTTASNLTNWFGGGSRPNSNGQSAVLDGSAQSRRINGSTPPISASPRLSPSAAWGAIYRTCALAGLGLRPVQDHPSYRPDWTAVPLGVFQPLQPGSVRAARGRAARLPRQGVAGIAGASACGVGSRARPRPKSRALRTRTAPSPISGRTCGYRHCAAASRRARGFPGLAAAVAPDPVISNRAVWRLRLPTLRGRLSSSARLPRPRRGRRARPRNSNRAARRCKRFVAWSA